MMLIPLGQLDSNPAAHANIGRPEVGVGRLLDQSGLYAGSRRDPHRYVTVAVVVIRKRHVDSHRCEKCRRAMRDLLDSAGDRSANAADAVELWPLVQLWGELDFSGSVLF